MFSPQPVVSEEELSLSGSLGITLNYFSTPNLTFSTYIEGYMLYTEDYPIGVNFGITMGYSFLKKRTSGQVSYKIFRKRNGSSKISNSSASNTLIDTKIPRYTMGK